MQKITTGLLIIVVLGILILVLVKNSDEESTEQFTNEVQTSVVPPIVSPPASSQADILTSFKTYTNTEYGFEFQYPEDSVIRENLFYSKYSKFNLNDSYEIDKKFYQIFRANVVLQEFADRTFLKVNAATSTVNVDGALGLKYEYMYEGNQELAIVLPLGEYKIILAMTSKTYEDNFDQILSSFKFTK